MAPDAWAGGAVRGRDAALLVEVGVVAVGDDGGVVAVRFDEAVTAAKQDENKEVAALVLRDKALQSVIACWPMVHRAVPADDVPPSLSLDQLWSLVQFDEREVVELSGAAAGLALAALRRAKGNRLIYPDGSVNQTAKVVLQALIKKAVS